MVRGVYKGQKGTREQSKRFVVGSEVNIVVPGIRGFVRTLATEPTQLGEYWHEIEYPFQGETRFRREPGCNLQFIAQPLIDPRRVFDEMREYAMSLANDDQRAEILQRVSVLEKARKTPAWAERCQELAAFASDQISVFGWLLPLLDKALL